MASDVLTMLLSNGQRLSIFDLTSEAVNAEKRVNINGVATTTSPYGFSVMSPCRVIDYLVGASSADGEFELTANGRRTGIRVPVHAGFYVAVNRKMQRMMPKFSLQPGIIYSFIQTVVRSA